jgi:hypothetical protein
VHSSGQLYALYMNRFTLVYLFFSGLVVSSSGVNIIVDDANSTWTFSPLGSWNAITPTEPCSGCWIHPDPSKVFNHTWHDTSGPPASAQLLFNGVSIQIYTICPPGNGSATYNTSFSFTLDNVDDGSFAGPTPACSEFIYNYLVYARTNLTNGPHVVDISNTNEDSALLVDYAIYDDGTSVPAPTVTLTSTQASLEGTHSHSSVPTGAIVATSVIAALLFIANLAQLFWYRRSKKLQSHVGGDGTSPAAYPLIVRESNKRNRRSWCHFPPIAQSRTTTVVTSRSVPSIMSPPDLVLSLPSRSPPDTKYPTITPFTRAFRAAHSALRPQLEDFKFLPRSFGASCTLFYIECAEK